MTISVGDTLPEATFTTMTADGPAKHTVADLCDGKKVVLVAVPGAFTPTCHANHLPGFVEHIDAMHEKGVDTVAFTSVNDVHVMNAWSEASGGKGKITFLSDGNADFAKAIGMDIDLGVAGMGVRSKRYAMVVENGVVTALNLEENPGQADKSSAAAILAVL
ncbi:MAG: peroxiredoxin [Pseudomonadota bacterium]